MGKRLLVADDSLTIQKVIKLALSNEGYEIQAVSDGNMALQIIPEFKPHAILIDISLPGQSAFEVKSAINQIHDLTNISFVLMSSAYEQVDEEQAKAVGFHGRLTKPFDPSQLRDILHSVLKGQDNSPPKPPVKNKNDFDSFELKLPPLPGIKRTQAGPSIPPPPPPNTGKKDNFQFEPPQTPWKGNDEGDEIKKLTESTIKMSGLDDFNWSVQEGAKLEPSLSFSPPPLPPVAPSFESYEKETTGMALKPPPSLEDDGGTNFRIELNSGEHFEFIPPPIANKGYKAPPVPPAPISDPFSSDPSIPNSNTFMNPDDVENIVKQQLESQLREMAKKLLPEIAEKVIREEIHKMLESQI